MNVWPSCLFATTAVLVPVISLLALAAWLAPYLVSRVGPARRLLPTVLALSATATVVAPVAFVRLTGQMAPPADTGGVFSFVAVVAGHVLATVGPALLVAGLVLPLTSCWYGSEANDRTGRGWGWLLAANGIGGLTGATIAGSLLMPRLGLHSGFTAIAACYAVLAVALCWLLDGNKRTWVVVGLARLADRGGRAVGASAAPDDPRSPTSGLSTSVVDARGSSRWSTRLGPDETLDVAAVDRSVQPVSAGQPRRVIHSQRRKMLLPLLLHAAPERVATIGMATGITAGAALDYEAVQSLTAVEISPLITAAAGRYFAAANRHLCDDPRTEVAVEDGRTYLAASHAAYDVVVGDLFRPWALGVGRLYSLEHFQAVRRALRPGGMYCQWLPMYQLEAPQFEVILATFQQAFSPVHLVRGSFRSTVPAIGLVGFRDGGNRLARTRRAVRALRRTDRVVDPSLRRVEGVLMYYLGAITTQAGPRRFANTLDNAWVEIDAGRGRVSQATRQAYLERERWIRFCAELPSRLEYQAGVPAEGAPLV